MKKILTLAALICVSITTNAQSNAKKLLDEVTAKVQSYNSFSLNFTYTISGKDSNGKLDVQKDKYVVEFMGVKQLYDGSKTYLINPMDEEVGISSKGSQDALSLSKILSFYTTGYTYTMDIKMKEAGKNIQYVKLKPTSQKNEVKEILLGIDLATKNIYKKIEVLKNGSKNTLTIKSFKTNPTFSKNHFTFTKSQYPNYYIHNID